MTSEAEVITEAIALLSARGSFTPAHYQVWQDDDEDDDARDVPGEGVVRMCAIGGVEQAIWRLTGKDVSADRNAVARRASTNRRTLYANVMRRPNRKARELYPDGINGDSVYTVEHVTFVEGSRSTVRRRTLRVFDAALKELS